MMSQVYIMYLVYGHNGWIGGQLVALLDQQGIVYAKGVARLDDVDAVEREIQTVAPTHVISFTGRTHGKIGDQVFSTIDYLEQPGKLRENVRDNLFAPMVLANLSRKYAFHFTYLGTGCIFEYDDTHPLINEFDTLCQVPGCCAAGCRVCTSDVSKGFLESDSPNFFGSGYSIMKGFTDRLMHMYEDRVLNVRIRMPITADLNPRNFITKILNYERICSVPNSMTVLPELLPILVDLIGRKVVGTVNLTNPGAISHNDILAMYREIVDPDFTWRNFSVDEQRAILAAGRSNNLLDTSRLETLYPGVRPIREAVRDIIGQLKKP
jgi:3,5-epimerase/4-reductase